LFEALNEVIQSLELNSKYMKILWIVVVCSMVFPKFFVWEGKIVLSPTYTFLMNAIGR